ncbi:MULTISPECIES: glycosyltransferase family 4 protein [unclassified Sporosarcina]|uniref:glycosyltransferase family 4 protein n=1 Tax=unclassified Sporosarcina TaxID=2647733 RepID=UPI00117C0DA7|nr:MULTISPECIES: glycosyltransferase family 4 protein [unclassified Sporosarcina]
MSLISLYTAELEKQGIDYDIIYVDKYGEIEKTNAKNVFRYEVEIKRGYSKFKKIKSYLKFKKYATLILKKNNYDRIIVWRSETALLFSSYLIKSMKRKYIINIRDYCKEKNPLIYFIMYLLINRSLFSTISSEGFKTFLPKQKYELIHSFNESVLSKSIPRNTFRKLGEPIRVCFLGYVRFFENDKKLLKALANDNRFIIQFFGEGSKYLEEFATKENINNVEFIPRFNLEETSKLLEKADVINNLYGFNDIALDTAVSIKYYYSLFLHIPILVYKGTYMEKLIDKSTTGYAVNEDLDNLADKFYKWYHNLNFEDFSNACNREMKEVKECNKSFQKLLKLTFHDNK